MAKTTLFQHPENLIAPSVRFWLMLPSFILSMICSVFVLYHILIDRTQRTATHNFPIILLLISGFLYQSIEIPSSLAFLRFNRVHPATQTFCLFWMFMDEILFSLSLLFVAGATVQRYIFIFHKKYLSSSRRRFLFSYLPLLVLMMYSILFHFVTILIPPCENTFDYGMHLCGHPLCYYNTKSVALWDTVFNDMCPTIVIIIFSITLLLRVVIQKYRMGHRASWRKHRKITVQMLLIASLYLFLYIPLMSVELLQYCCIPEYDGANFEVFANFFSMFVTFICPFVLAGFLPNLNEKLKRLFIFPYERMCSVYAIFNPSEPSNVQRHNTVAPTISI